MPLSRLSAHQCNSSEIYGHAHYVPLMSRAPVLMPPSQHGHVHNVHTCHHQLNSSVIPRRNTAGTPQRRASAAAIL
ncbi:MAG: hypothetical protein IJG36_03725 [Synergistaceae bacterium]|nr:hypothetical protein [Synergistaceae bacterium]